MLSNDWANNKAKEKNQEILSLQDKLNMLLDELDNANSILQKQYISTEIQNTQHRLESWVEYITKGAMVRSKTKWYEEGECNSQ